LFKNRERAGETILQPASDDQTCRVIAAIFGADSDDQWERLQL
jgi:hypothetical protein